jgi:hypothetical protein
MICTTTTSMNKKGPPYRSPTMKCTRPTVASLGQGDEGSENGMFEDPLCSLSKSLGIHGVDAPMRPRRRVQVTDNPTAIVLASSVRLTTLVYQCERGFSTCKGGDKGAFIDYLLLLSVRGLWSISFFLLMPK